MSPVIYRNRFAALWRNLMCESYTKIYVVVLVDELLNIRLSYVRHVRLSFCNCYSANVECSMMNITYVQVLPVKRRIIGRALLEFDEDIPYFYFTSNPIVATDCSSRRDKINSTVSVSFLAMWIRFSHNTEFCMFHFNQKIIM